MASSESFDAGGTTFKDSLDCNVSKRDLVSSLLQFAETASFEHCRSRFHETVFALRCCWRSSFEALSRDRISWVCSRLLLRVLTLLLALCTCSCMRSMALRRMSCCTARGKRWSNRSREISGDASQSSNDACWDWISFSMCCSNASMRAISAWLSATPLSSSIFCSKWWEMLACMQVLVPSRATCTFSFTLRRSSTESSRYLAASASSFWVLVSSSLVCLALRRTFSEAPSSPSGSKLRCVDPNFHSDLPELCISPLSATIGSTQARSRPW
mmetsp:Transcript_93351/g.221974  ORF Transcript_93351/g.221974 Transcript_93351/m.221974 type:complete len:271 (+) Transcript_93351:781-1593(+)